MEDQSTVPRRLAGRVAIVTGGGGPGIGQAICRRFAREGAAVLVVDRDEDSAQAVAAAIVRAGGRAQAFACDLAEASAASRMVEAAQAAFGGLDILVNHAGVPRGGDAISLSEADWDLVWNLNVKAGFLAAKHAVPMMKARGGGVILFTGSTASVRPVPGVMAYAASKAAIETMVRAMAMDFGRDNIRVNAVLPGFMMRDANDMDPRPLVPLGARPGRADEVANVYLFLASDEASYVSGVSLRVDGGLMAGLMPPG